MRMEEQHGVAVMSIDQVRGFEAVGALFRSTLLPEYSIIKVLFAFGASMTNEPFAAMDFTHQHV